MDLDKFAWKLIERRTEQIGNMGHKVVDPLPEQVKNPVLYANALLTQLWTLKAEARTQELHVVSGDLGTEDLDLEL